MSLSRIVLLLAGCIAAPVFAAQQADSRPAEARITSQAPEGLVPASHLTAQDRRDNFEALWRAIDVTYADFALKSIDWNLVGRRYRAQLDGTTSDAAYYRLLGRMVADLQDTHSWLQNYREPPRVDVPSVAVDLVGDVPYVVAVTPGSDAARAGIAPGMEILAVDRQPARERMDALRAVIGGFSSERAGRREAARRLLSDATAAPATIDLRLPRGDTRTVTLSRGPGRPAARPGVPEIPGVSGSDDLRFGLLPSGHGYIRVLSFSNRDSLDREFDAALEALRTTPSLILDVRDNAGGFSHPWIVGRFLASRVKTTISFVKTGAAHDAFRQLAGYDAPTGPWQYTRPVVLLVNDLTGSAADLFVAELRSAKRVTLVGSTTHGDLSGTAAYATLPCHLVVRISNGYVADAGGRAVEVNGTVPDILVAPTVDDVISARDPVLARAIAVLTK